MAAVAACFVFLTPLREAGHPTAIKEIGRGKPLPEEGTVMFLLSPVADHSTRITSAKTRPLFAETRRLPMIDRPSPPKPTPEILTVADVPQAEPEAAPIPPDLVFSGFFLSDGQASALITTSEISSETWVKLGDMVGDWRVAHLTNTSLILQLGDIQHIVKLAR